MDQRRALKRGSVGALALYAGLGILAVWTLRGSASAARGFAGQPPRGPTESSAAQPTYHCRRAAGPIRVNGVLDDPGWRNAAVTEPFLNWDAHGVPEYPTVARMAWDARNLYIAFECKDADIYSPYTHRDDSLWNEDVVEVFLSIDGYPHDYFEFEVSPANVIFDAKIHTPGPPADNTLNKAWNARGMKTAVRVDGTLNQRGDKDRGWTVEIALPFVDLGLPRAPQSGTTWRMNLYRIDRSSENNYATWSPTLGTTANFHKPVRFGYLVFAP